MVNALCGCRECEKRGVLTALKQFQYSAGAGGVWTFGWAGGVRAGSVKEWMGEGELRGRALFCGLADDIFHLK